MMRARIRVFRGVYIGNQEIFVGKVTGGKIWA